MARTDDKRRGRLNIITHLLGRSLTRVAPEEDRAAEAAEAGDYREPNYPYKYVKEVF